MARSTRSLTDPYRAKDGGLLQNGDATILLASHANVKNPSSPSAWRDQATGRWRIAYQYVDEKGRYVDFSLLLSRAPEWTISRSLAATRSASTTSTSRVRTGGRLSLENEQQQRSPSYLHSFPLPFPPYLLLPSPLAHRHSQRPFHPSGCTTALLYRSNQCKSVFPPSSSSIKRSPTGHQALPIVPRERIVEEQQRLSQTLKIDASKGVLRRTKREGEKATEKGATRLY